MKDEFIKVLKLRLNEMALLCVLKNRKKKESIKIMSELLRSKEGEEIIKELCKDLKIKYDFNKFKEEEDEEIQEKGNR